MKRNLVIGLSVCLACILIGCGTVSTEENPKESQQTTKEDASENENALKNEDETLSIESLANMKETPEEEFDYFIFEECVYLNGYLGESEVIIIPDEIEGYPVVDIGDAAFRNNTNIKAVRIGNNVKTVGKNAFINCSALEYVVFGNSVESVGQFAFIGCANMIEIQLNEGLLTVGEQAICSAEVPTIIPRSVTEIGLNGFKQPVKVYKGSYAESYIIDYANNYGAEFVYEIIE